jgi:spoIIIJ-associated protein
LGAWIDDAKLLAKGLIERMGVEAEAEVVLHEKDLLVEIKGDEEGLLIGKGGRTMDALQILFSRMINKQLNGSIRVLIDVDGYRKGRTEVLTRMALRSGETVKASGKAIVVGPFTAQERRIIHLAL